MASVGRSTRRRVPLPCVTRRAAGNGEDDAIIAIPCQCEKRNIAIDHDRASFPASTTGTDGRKAAGYCHAVSILQTEHPLPRWKSDCPANRTRAVVDMLRICGDICDRYYGDRCFAGGSGDRPRNNSRGRYCDCRTGNCVGQRLVDCRPSGVVRSGGAVNRIAAPTAMIAALHTNRVSRHVPRMAAPTLAAASRYRSPLRRS